MLNGLSVTHFLSLHQSDNSYSVEDGSLRNVIVI